jgi:hypothetical protein
MDFLIKTPSILSIPFIIVLWVYWGIFEIGLAAEYTPDINIPASEHTNNLSSISVQDSSASGSPTPLSSNIFTVTPTDKNIEIREGESLVFELKAHRQSSGIRGVEWYIGGKPYVQRIYDEGFAGSQWNAVFVHEHTFSNPGKHEVVAIMFDDSNDYFATNIWKVTVVGPTKNTFIKEPADDTQRIDEEGEINFLVKAANNSGLIRRIEWTSLHALPDSIQYADGNNIITLGDDFTLDESSAPHILTVKKGEKITFDVISANETAKVVITNKTAQINGPTDEIDNYRASFERTYKFRQSGVYIITAEVFNPKEESLHKVSWKVIVGQPFLVSEILFGYQHLGYLGISVATLTVLLILLSFWVFRKNYLR